MRFLMQGIISAAAIKAMEHHAQRCHRVEELGEEGANADTPAALLKLLEKKQWELLTTDGAFITAMYEQKVAFSGVIVLLLETGEAEQAAAVDRLFERYKRLTPRRMYTVTPSRVKIRQLPGAAQA